MYLLMLYQKSVFLFTLLITLYSSASIAAETGSSINGSTLVTSEPITLDIHFHFHERRNVYDNNWPVEKRAAELTGISLNNITPKDSDKGNEAFNLMMANGEWPDIVGGTALRDKFNQFGPSGYFLPLNELIEEHAPYIHSFVQNNPDLIKSISAPDGNLYYIPYIPDGKFGRAYFIRTDWLDTLGLDVPETVNELHSVLTAFLNNDPNGNGEKDEIPFFARDFEEMVRLVTLWDARTSGSDSWHDFYISDNTVLHGYIEENYRNGINHLAQWYQEGLIDKNITDLTNRGGDIRMEMLSNNLGGMTHDWFASTASFNDKLSADIDGFSFKPFAPPQSISGRRMEEHRRTSVKPDGWAITKSNKAVIETIKYFDFWFSPEGKRLANFGIEGDEYNLIDGKPVFTEDVLHGEIPVNTRLWSVGAQVPRGFPQDYAYERQWTNKIALDGIDLYEKGNYLVEPFFGVTLSTDEKETVDFYWNTLLAYMLERQEEWIRGIRDVNKDWDSYLLQLQKLGMNKVMKVMQTAYNRQYVSTNAEFMEK